MYFTAVDLIISKGLFNIKICSVYDVPLLFCKILVPVNLNCKVCLKGHSYDFGHKLILCI